MCKTERIKEFIESHIPLLCFFLFLLLSSFILFVFQSRAMTELKQRNEKILSHYNQVLSVKQIPGEITSFDVELYVREFRLSPSQSIAFQDYTRKIIEKAVSRSHDEMDVNALVEARSETMYQETKDLLELQFAKIQHETESLQIWCGILTIVFLIFSFYSLFKTDELVLQGREGVKELAALQEIGKNSIEKLENDGKTKIDSFESESKIVIESVKNTNLAERQVINDEIQKMKGEAIAGVNASVDKANTMLDQKYQDLAKALEDKKQEQKDIIEKGREEQVASIISSIESLRHRLDEIERQNKQDNG